MAPLGGKRLPPIGIAAVFGFATGFIGRVAGPPDGPTFAERDLGVVHPGTGGFFLLRRFGMFDRAARLHELFYQPLAFGVIQPWVCTAP